MLIAYTHTDADSNLTKSFALSFLELAGTRGNLILKPRTSSNASSIRNGLKSNATMPFFFFGHGQDDPNRTPQYYLEGQDLQPALDETDGTLLQDRLVIAICCYGLDALTNTAKPHMYNATVLGYQGPLELAQEAPYVFDLEDCLLAGLKELQAGKTANDALQATQTAYANVIARLRNGSFTDRLNYRQVFDPNSKGVGIAGDGTKTI